MTTEPSRRSALIAELNACARFHFGSEENIMVETGYPQLAKHRQHHRDLISELNATESMPRLPRTDKRAEEIVEFPRDWLIGLTVGEDRPFAGFYHRQKKH